MLVQSVEETAPYERVYSNADYLGEVICHCTTRTFAFWCGGIIFLSGLLSALATKYKTNFL